MTKNTGKNVARFALHPTANAALTLQEYCATQWAEDAGFEALSDELERQINETCKGGKEHTVKTLASQSSILDMLFQTLCRKAIRTVPGGGDVRLNQGYLRLALKCQKQSAATTAMLQYLIPEDEKSKNELSKISKEKIDET